MVVGLVEDKSPDALVQECLQHLGLSLLSDWDVLLFLYRHRANLSSTDQIARLIGYPSETVGSALERLESQALILPSRQSRGVGLYQFVFSEPHLAPESFLRQLIRLSDSRSGRLLLLKHLRRNVASPVVAKEPNNKRK